VVTVNIFSLTSVTIASNYTTSSSMMVGQYHCWWVTLLFGSGYTKDKGPPENVFLFVGTFCNTRPDSGCQGTLWVNSGPLSLIMAGGG